MLFRDKEEYIKKKKVKMPGINKPQQDKKMKQACDECHKRRVRCNYNILTQQCQSCVKLGINCKFLRKPLKRGPNTGSRKDRKNLINVSLPPSPRDSRRSSTSSRSNSIIDVVQTNSNMIPLIEKLYRIQAVQNWIPLIPFEMNEIIQMSQNIKNSSLQQLFQKIIQIAIGEIIENDTNGLLLNISSIVGTIQTSDEITIFLSCLLLIQCFKPNKIILAMSIGIWSDLQTKVNDITSHRIEYCLNVIDLLCCPINESLMNRPIMGYTQKYFSTIGSLQTIENMNFFEQLREQQLQSNNSKIILSVLPCHNALFNSYKTLVMHKYEFIEPINNKLATTQEIIPSLTQLLEEIKQLLHKLSNPGHKMWFEWVAIEETRRDIQALRDIPSHLLKGLMSTNNSPHCNNTIIDAQIIYVTQAMNDLVECTGLLGALLGGNIMTTSNNSNVPVIKLPQSPTSSRASVLEINHIINHEQTLLPQSIIRRLSNTSYAAY
ncbi:hypothetical protein C6P45_002079 [Maudiozyma exigua]|uniref:Zn(2)-C6 fungal-type domain-containing protein n=1 Tax=Maudiozyma exigua TaxID=34358 RepID=A0A9P6W0B7_MAUEX|nr:hypothetical protein C6P45_002079 [Kazachstania exigua]